MISFFNGDYVPRETVHISPDDRGFVFGDGVYEVIRVYRGRPFALAAHCGRLARSLREIRLDWPAVAELPRFVGELLEANGLGRRDALVYFQVTRGVVPRDHAFPPPGTPPTIFGGAAAYRADTARDDGIAAVLCPDIRWARCDIKAVGLLANVMAHQRARDMGADEAIFVRDGVAIEATRANLCAVRDGVLVTHPLTNVVLPGVTRAVVLEVCRAVGIPVTEAPVLAEAIDACSEVMLLGTTAEVTPVVRLDGRPVGDGRPGPVCRRLAAAFRERVASGID
jgi:D-alanine transaminase